MHSYGYGNLIDRWYSVYDRHYRPPTTATEEEYRVQHYAPVWETSAFESSNPSFGLEDLKRMALEGVSQTIIPAPKPEGEAEYKSMPLEGRIDLMRPSRPNQRDETPASTDIGDHGSQQQHDTSAQHQQRVDHGYRPPGREGLPSYLYNDSQPQQPQHPQHPHPAPHSTHHDHQSDQHHVQENLHQPEHYQESQSWDHHQGDHGGHHESHSPVHRPPSPPLLIWNAALDPPPHNPPPLVGMAFTEQQYANTWDLPAGQPMRQESAYEDPWVAHSAPHDRSSPPTYHQHPHHYPDQSQDYQHQQQHQQQHHHQQQNQQQQYHHHQGSPSFPTDGHYKSVHSHGQQERTYPGHSHVDHNRYQPYPDSYHGQEVPSHAAPRPYRQSRPEDFFRAPASHKIPSHLMREGHYAAVTAAEPNVGKVEAIFPWEQRSRPTPRRVFPDWDPKPPRLKSPIPKTVAEIEEALIAASLSGAGVAAPPYVDPRTPSPPPPAHVKRKFNPPPSPPRREGATYVNAWDTDSGIQRYASKLQGRSSTSPKSPQPWPFHPGQEAESSKAKKSPSVEKEEEEEYTNWTEKAEASSRDGDDEDDEDGSPILSPRSSARHRAAKAKGNSYRHQGVQTDPKVTESRGVQVSSSSFMAYKRHAAPTYRSSYSGNDDVDELQGFTDEFEYGTRQEKPLLPAFEEELADPTFLPSTALHNAEERTKAVEEIGSPTGPILRTRDSSEDSITTAAESSIISSPTKEVEEVGTPRVQILVPEPAESPPLSGRMRQGSSATGRRMGGRVFSPTTGVDIFKRGSEEVLARFLMQDPSGWSGARNASQGPPTPSTIH